MDPEVELMAQALRSIKNVREIFRSLFLYHPETPGIVLGCFELEEKIFNVLKEPEHKHSQPQLEQ